MVELLFGLEALIANSGFEHNRRYHAFGSSPYWGPNDEEANEQQDLAHHLYCLTLDGKLYLAPIENPRRILDLGTGTGIWAIDLADAYPDAVVTGTDLSPVQPQFVPVNCFFEINDFNLPWTFRENSFDFIHARELFGCVEDWDKLLFEIYQALEPGGYVEIVEHSVCPRADDGTVGPDHFFSHWGQTVLEMGDKWNKSFRICDELKDRMRHSLEGGQFEDVTEVRYKWPINSWPKDLRFKELGKWNQLRLYHGVESFMLRLLTSAGGWAFDRAQLYLAEMRAAIKDRNTHAFLDVVIVYARKPNR